MAGKTYQLGESLLESYSRQDLWIVCPQGQAQSGLRSQQRVPARERRHYQEHQEGWLSLGEATLKFGIGWGCQNAGLCMGADKIDARSSMHLPPVQPIFDIPIVIKCFRCYQRAKTTTLHQSAYVMFRRALTGHSPALAQEHQHQQQLDASMKEP